MNLTEIVLNLFSFIINRNFSTNLPPLYNIQTFTHHPTRLTWDLETKFTLTANMCDISSFSLSGDPLCHLPGWFSSDLHQVWAAWYVLICKLHVDDIVAGLSGFIGDAAGAILIVMALNVCLAGALNGQGQATITLESKMDILSLSLNFKNGLAI